MGVRAVAPLTAVLVKAAGRAARGAAMAPVTGAIIAGLSAATAHVKAVRAMGAQTKVQAQTRGQPRRPKAALA